MPSSDGYDVIDCCNSIMMAGGIDLHTHIGGGKTNIARMLMPEELVQIEMDSNMEIKENLFQEH